MKIILVSLILLSTNAYGQSGRKQEKTIERLEQQIAEQEAILKTQNEQITQLAELLSQVQTNSQANIELIEKLRKENETLREIMRGYILQIDQLNTTNMELENDLDKCKGEQIGK